MGANDKISEKFRYILAPANLCQDHWIAFCADTEKKIVKNQTIF